VHYCEKEETAAAAAADNTFACNRHGNAGCVVISDATIFLCGSLNQNAITSRNTIDNIKTLITRKDERCSLPRLTSLPQ